MSGDRLITPTEVSPVLSSMRSPSAGHGLGEEATPLAAVMDFPPVDTHATRRRSDVRHMWCLRTESRRRRAMWASIVLMVLFSVVLGLTSKHTPSVRHPWNRVSAVIGWLYFVVWSASFYPQVYLNYVRKSTEGLSTDYELYNITGFVAYAIFNVTYRWDSGMQAAYRDRHHGKENRVDLNDVAFAVHAVILTVITIAQIVMYRGEKPSRLATWSCAFTWVVAVLYALIIAFAPGSKYPLDWFTFVYCLSLVKLAVTLVKYCPQVWMHYKRKTTTGWNIWNVLLDITGGVLSTAQLMMDSGLNHDWSGVTGDVVKFGLGVVSIVFDVIFMVQHYILYPEGEAKRRLSAPMPLHESSNIVDDWSTLTPTSPQSV